MILLNKQCGFLYLFKAITLLAERIGGVIVCYDMPEIVRLPDKPRKECCLK